MSTDGRIAITERDGVAVATLEGEFDISNVDELSERVRDEMSDDAAGVVLDLTAVRYIDSAGIRLLFSLARRLEDSRYGMALVLQPASPVRTLVTITNLGDVAPVFDSLDDAIAALRKAAEDRI